MGLFVRFMVVKSLIVLSILISGVAVFPGSLSARSAPKGVVSSRNAPKVVVPLFVKKPRLKVQYGFFVKILTKQAPDIKIAFEKAFAWGFKPATRSDADKKAETALLDALEADTKLAPVYKEAIFTFSEDMHPSPWGKIILGSVGGIAATAALVAAGMWYRDKRRAAQERVDSDRVERDRVEQYQMQQVVIRMQQTDEALKKQEESVKKILADLRPVVLEISEDLVSQSQRGIKQYKALNTALQRQSSELEAIKGLLEEDRILVAIPGDEVQISSELRSLIQARNKAKANAIESYQKAKATEESAAKILREIDGALEDIDILETQKHTSLSKHRVKTSSSPLPVLELGAASRLTPAQLNDMKQLFGIESGTSDAENSVLIESRETAIWNAYCKDIAICMPQAQQKIQRIIDIKRDRSRGRWHDIKMWQDAQRALNKRMSLAKSDLTAASLGILGKGISNFPDIPNIFYYLRTVSPIDGTSQFKDKIVFFDSEGVEIERLKIKDIKKFDFLGRIANTPRAQKLTDLIAFLTRAPKVSVVPPTTVVSTGSGVGGTGVGAGAPSGPGATDATGAASGRMG